MTLLTNQSHWGLALSLCLSPLNCKCLCKDPLSHFKALNQLVQWQKYKNKEKSEGSKGNKQDCYKLKTSSRLLLLFWYFSVLLSHTPKWRQKWFVFCPQAVGQNKRAPLTKACCLLLQPSEPHCWQAHQPDSLCRLFLIFIKRLTLDYMMWMRQRGSLSVCAQRSQIQFNSVLFL